MLTLSEMLRLGGEVQRNLNERAERLMEVLNEIFMNHRVPLTAVHFGSFFRFAQSGNLSFVYQPLEIDLFFYHLIEKGVYVWEGRTCFISTAHDDSDMDFIIQAVHASVVEMKAGGFWPECGGPGSGASTGPGTGGPGHAGLRSRSGAAAVPRALTDAAATAPRASNAGVDASRSSLLGRAMRKDSDGPVARMPEPARPPVPVTPLPPPIIDGSFIARRSGESVVDFSLYYFGDLTEDAQADKYGFLIDGARFASESGFQAVWLPERHFHSFGGFSPNPAVVAAALARETHQIELRASVLLPLHHPIRVAEEWAVLDNLSGGRVGLALASGWHANDFVFDPASWDRKRDVMIERLGALQHLWRVSKVPFPGPDGRAVEVSIFPRPTRASLPLWLTTLGNRETWDLAGRLGLGVLTNLIGQKIADIAENIRLYRAARAQAGLDPMGGHVTVLLHTLVGTDLTEVREQAREPFCRYLASSLGLFQKMVRDQGLAADFDNLTAEDRAFLLNAAYERYVDGSALIGTAASTAKVVDELVAAGVDELACFIDFGVEHDYARRHLRTLAELKDRYRKSPGGLSRTAPAYTSIAPIVTPSGTVARPRAAMTTPATATGISEDEDEPVTVRLPLTGDQRMLWFLARMGTDGLMAYAQTSALRLTGPLDTAALQRAYQIVVARHEALRTIIAADGESQAVLASGTSVVPVIDLAALDPAQRAHQLDAILADEAERPFDLAEGLARLALVQLTATEHVLILTAHHLVCDGVSIGIILTELAALYETAGDIAVLSPAPSFAEHVRWRLTQHQEAEYAREEAYWLRVIGTGLPALELPTDRRRPPVKAYDGDRLTLTLDAAFFACLKRFSQEIRSTYFMVVLSAFAALLHRLARQDEVVVGVPFAGRGREGSENMVGYLSNVYPIVSRLELEDTVATYLDRLRATLLDAYDHQSYPFSALVDKALSSRDASRSPFFSVAFNWDRVDLPRISGLMVEGLEFRPRYVEYDLMPNVMEVNGEIVISWDYSTALFDRATIETLASQFVTLIRALVQSADVRVHDLPLRDEAADAAFIAAHGAPRLATTQSDWTLADLLTTAATAHGARVAVIAGTASITYATLARRAHALARALHRMSIGRGERVAILLDPSLELLIAMHGVLAAGAAYVPLNTRYPAARLRELIADSGAAAIIRAVGHYEDVVAGSTVRSLGVDELGDSGGSDMAAPPSRALPDDIAYVLYTSGTTGKPKGVLVRHRNVTSFLAAATEMLAMDGSETLLNVSPASFDMSVPDFFLPLLNGGTVIVASTDERLTPAQLIALIDRYDIDFMQATPTVWRMLVDAGWTGKPGLRICAGGEMFPSSLAAELLERGYSVWNGYGPTETTVWSNVQRVDRAHLARAIVPVGPALPNSAVYVVDERGRLVPEGHVGEILIGGGSVAAGYLGRPELTSERFLPNPFGPGTVYRTGDLGRYRTGGVVEVVGRTDEQVKIRGFRVELGEIEAVLESLPGVRRAAATVQSAGTGGNSLVAFVEAARSASLDGETLRHAARELLPDYMVPRVIVVVDSLPQSANGKIDRQRLPAVSLSAGQRDFTAPRTPVEATIARTFAELLGMDRVGAHDDFFELGGSSLLLARLQGMLSERLGATMPITRLFNHSSVAQVATLVETSTAGTPVSNMPAQNAVSSANASPRGPHDAVLQDSSEALPLLPALTYHMRHLGYSTHFNLSRLFRVVDPAITSSVMAAAISDLARHHEALRLTIHPGPDGELVQGVMSAEHGPRLARIDLSQIPVAERRVALEDEAARRQLAFRFEAGVPLVQAVWFELGANEAPALLVIAHFAVTDVYGFELLVEDLVTICRARLAEEQPALAPTTPFSTWLQRYIAYACNEAVDELGYWLGVPWQRAHPLAVDDQAEVAAEARKDMLFHSEDHVRMERIMSGRERASDAEVRELMARQGIHFFTLPGDAYRRLVTAVEGSAESVDALLLAFYEALEPRISGNLLPIDFMFSNRRLRFPGVDISRTVMRAAENIVLPLDLAGTSGAQARLARVSSIRAGLPSGGLALPALRALNRDPDVRRRVEAVPLPMVGFNYLSLWPSEQGVIGQMLEYTSEAMGLRIGYPRDRARGVVCQLYIDKAEDGLLFAIIYEPRRLTHDSVEAIGVRLLDSLARLTSALTLDTGGQAHPGDFAHCEA